MGFTPTNDTLATELRRLKNQLFALATTPMLQNSSIKHGYCQVLDLEGHVQVIFGDFTFLTGPAAGQAVCGVVTFNAATGLPQTFQGSMEWPVGAFKGQTAYGLFTFDGSGNIVFLQGAQPDGSYGAAAWSPAGVKMAAFGELSTSPDIYGMAVLNNAGVMQQVAGSVQAQAVDPVSTSATTWTTLTGGPSVTATIGPSGMAKVIFSVYAQAPYSNDASVGVGQASVGVGIDGAAPASGEVYLSVEGPFAAFPIGQSAEVSQLVSGLSPGSHTFELWYETYPNPSSSSFGQRVLIVEPL